MHAGIVALLVGAIGIAGCNLFGETGGVVFAANEWDEDVVVRIESVHSDWKLIPARTKADLLGGYGRPRPGDRVVVFSRACQLVGAFPLTGDQHTLHITKAGRAEFVEARFVETGPETVRVPPYEGWFDRDSWCVEEFEQVAAPASEG